MTTGAVNTPHPASLPPKGASRAIGKRPRMSTFLRILVAITVVAHTPFLLAVVVFAKRIAFPAPWTRDRKFWPAVGRLNNALGDRKLICACPPVEAYADA